MVVLVAQVEEELVQHRVLDRDTGKQVVDELLVEYLLSRYIGDCQ